ncbi:MULTISPECIES: hypothetical protein [Brevibacillus]
MRKNSFNLGIKIMTATSTFYIFYHHR